MSAIVADNDTVWRQDLSKRRLRAIEAVDEMAPELRECVHEYGYSIVSVFLQFGIENPTAIRHIINTVRLGARDGAQNRAPLLSAIDVLMAQGPLSSHDLFRLLQHNNWAIVPIDPTRGMVAASLEEVSGFNVRCTKEEKHRRRLRAALKAGMEERAPLKVEA